MNKNSSEQFSKLLKLKNDERKLIWDDSKYTGFTIYKEYRDFIVERNDGENDLYCLIKIAFRNDSESSRKLLKIDLSIQSKYQQSNHGIILSGDEKNPLIPKQESIEKFNRSHVPFNLSTSEKLEISYNPKDNTFYWNNEKMTLREIVDKIYTLHTNSSSIINRVIYHYPTLIFSYSFEYLIYFFLYKFLHRIIIGGRRIKDEEYFKFFLFYGNEIKIEESEKLKIDESNLEVQLPLFGGKLNMNRNGIFWGIFILGYSAIQYFYNKSCDNKLMKLFEFYKDNEIISGVLIIIWLFIFSFIFSRILPVFTVYIINLMIGLRKGILNKFYYKGLKYDTGSNPYKKSS